MKKRKINKLNIKSEKGFTMQDLVGAIIVLSLFVGIIGMLMTSVVKVNLKTRMSASATNYAIQILEDIDKISYEEVTSSLANSYPSKFLIPSGFTVNLEVENYNEGTDKQDLVKTVKLTISYTLFNEKEDLVINKLKMKEISV